MKFVLWRPEHVFYNNKILQLMPRWIKCITVLGAGAKTQWHLSGMQQLHFTFQVSTSFNLRSATFQDTMQRTVVLPHWRFGTTYQSHLQGSRNFLTLQDGTYHVTLCNIPEEHRSYPHHGRSLNSINVYNLWSLTYSTSII